MPETKLESRTPRAADTAQPQPKSHGLALKDRRHLAVTGVIRVISCDENAAVLETPLGRPTAFLMYRCWTRGQTPPLCWKRRSAT